MTDSTRRDFVKFLAAAPLAEFALSAADLEHAAVKTSEALTDLRQRGQQYRPRYFSPDDWQTVRILVDLIIPRDERSGSGTDAGVPEFMDFMLGDRPNMRNWMRRGLAWLDAECVGRFNAPFRECTMQQRTAVLDDIAWPRRARPELRPGVQFFNNFRNFTASGFWSSKMGVEDLEYMGNRPVASWAGCPPAALRKLGVTY